MKQRTIGKSDLKVSEICLGTMTWGSQNTEEDAFEQIDYALANGINFLDTAELYAVPPSPETYGLTEEYIGRYFQKHPEKRKDVIIATKIAGVGVGYVRNGEGFTPQGLEKAIEKSLQRLQMDYVDLYQLHWSQRMAPRFGQRDYQKEWFAQEDKLAETLGVLGKIKQKGLIREIGLSNEHSWGVMHCLRLHERDSQIPRVQSVQNAYNLLTRGLDGDLAEVLVREKVGLLPYSPLAGGLLSGKYENGNLPEGARFTVWGKDIMSRYVTQGVEEATSAYVQIAQKHDLDPSQMALSFVTNRAYVSSNIIGATSVKQLKANIDSKDLELSKEVIKEIEAVHRRIPNPAA